MVIKSTVSFREYARLIYGLLYSKPVMKLLVGIALLIVAWIAIYYLRIISLPQPLIYQYITLFLISVVQPGIIYYTIRRNYYSSNHLRETLRIEVTPNEIKINGKSFYLEILWARVFKVVEHHHWFLIYENNLSAIVVDKKDMSKKQLSDFRELLETIPGKKKVTLKEV